ncbi:MAG: hypothetical protein ACREB3_00690, partial [Burkholderiales bacterium]
AVCSLAAGSKTRVTSIQALFKDALPSTWVDEATNRSMRLVVHGAKKRVSEMGGELTLAEMTALGILTPDGERAIRERRWEILKHRETFEYYGRLVENGYGLDGNAGPLIATIHAVKGEQAERVTVFTEMGRRCWEDSDAEHRVAYVAVTRTQGDLEICGDQLVDWASARYDYPTEQEALAADER